MFRLCAVEEGSQPLKQGYGEIRNGSPAVLLVSLGAPVKILHRSSTNGGAEIIEIANEDDYRMIMRVFSQTSEESYDSFVQEMAYVLAEARGFAPGHEHEDWFAAERLVRKVATRGTCKPEKKNAVGRPGMPADMDDMY